MDAEITDLTTSGAAEMVVGPVVFDNFVLDHPGRWKNLTYCLDHIKIDGCIVQECHTHVVVLKFEHFQILHDEEGPCHPPCYV